jgi:UDP-N-acetylmuramoyl-tripeptide--D-alanyl-D-alanine ligase
MNQADHVSTSAADASGFWTARSVAAATGGVWLHAPTDNAPLAGLTIDSRAIKRGQVFLALRGERLDGHDFVTTALGAGAGMVIVNQAREEFGKLGRDARVPVLGVPSELNALHDLARAYRTLLRQAGVKVIAVTGSCGKTTTRHLIHTVLSAARRGTQSPKSFNNHIGVPLTLLAAGAGDDFVAMEIGTNHPGEIAALTQIAQPDAAVITMIGRAHIEHFGTRDAIAREKGMILGQLPAGGLAVVPAGEPLLDPVLQALPPHVKVVRFGPGPQTDLTWSSVEAVDGGQGLRVAVDNTTFHIPLAGEHHALDALAAVALGRWMGLSDTQMAQALAAVQPVAMRMQVVTLGPPARRVTVINDAYNANPDSVAAALHMLSQTLAQQKPKRCLVVLGDMLELGEHGPDEHRRVGQLLAEMESKVDAAILIGRLSLFTAESLSRAWPPQRITVIPQWDDTTAARVAARVEPGDLLLIKASRSMGLERLVPAIEKALSQTP